MEKKPEKTITMTRADSISYRYSSGVLLAIYEPELESVKFLLQDENCITPFNFEEKEKDSDYLVNDQGIAVIKIKGVILKNEDDVWFNDETSQEFIRNSIDASISNEYVKSIRLEIDSPGGIAQGVQELSEHILSAGKKKKILATIDGMCCSAAYWIASAANKIECTPSSLIGSIGVIYTHYDNTKTLENLGIVRTYISAGKYKTLGAPKTLTESDKKILQERVDYIYNIFTTTIATNRKLQLDKSHWADGKVFFGNQAYDYDLVDAIIKDQLPHSAEKKDEIMAENEKATTSTPQADVKSLIEKAVAEREQEILTIAKCVLGNEQGERLEQTLATGMNINQINLAKQLFSTKEEEKKEKASFESTVDDRVKSILSSLLEGANPAANVKKETLENAERTAWLESVGNYGKKKGE